MVATPNTPIVNAGSLYLDNLSLEFISSKTFFVGTGSGRDATNINDIINDALLTVDIRVVGPNGVDVAFTANNMYAVYIIGDSTQYQPTAAIVSLNFTEPLMPFGYDMARRIGSVYINGSSNIQPFFQYGRDRTRTMWYNDPQSVLVAGASATMATVSLAPVVHPRFSEVYLQYEIIAAGASVVEINNFNASTTNGNVWASTPVAGTVRGNVWVNSGRNGTPPAIKYKISAGTVSLLVAAYKDFLL